MHNLHYRYFIELQPRDGVSVPRFLEAETRRAAAQGFIQTMRAWLREKNLGEKVSALNVTMFGQIQITCEAAVINLIRHQDTVDIAAIRQGALHPGAAYMENHNRWNEAR